MIAAAPDAICYRLAQSGDFDAISELRTEIFSPHLTSTYSRYMQRRQYSESLQSKAAVVVAVWDELETHNVIVGAADLAAMDDCDGAAYVTNVCVHPGARRRGIGGRLVAQLERVAAAMGMQTLALHVDHSNVAAIELYRLHGYADGGEERLRAAAAMFLEEEDGEDAEASIDESPQLLMSKALDLSTISLFAQR